MSEHRLDIEIQKLAIAIQAIRAQLAAIEDIIQEALIKENQNDRSNTTMDPAS